MSGMRSRASENSKSRPRAEEKRGNVYQKEKLGSVSEALWNQSESLEVFRKAMVDVGNKLQAINDRASELGDEKLMIMVAEVHSTIFEGVYSCELFQEALGAIREKLDAVIEPDSSAGAT